jgi:hypothetical protein
LLLIPQTIVLVLRDVPICQIRISDSFSAGADSYRHNGADASAEGLPISMQMYRPIVGVVDFRIYEEIHKRGLVYLCEPWI